MLNIYHSCLCIKNSKMYLCPKYDIILSDVRVLRKYDVLTDYSNVKFI